MSWKAEKKNYAVVYTNEGGAVLSAQGDLPVIEQDGFVFKDLARTGKLLPYEDWRLPAKERARDLAGRLSREEIAGLMLYSSHQLVPFTGFGPGDHLYNGEPFDPSRHDPAQVTDQQLELLRSRHIRHFLQMKVQDVRTSALWSNHLQAACEHEPFGIPMSIATDPRHGVTEGGAEFRNVGQDVSKWPEGIGFAAIGDPELVRQFARIAAREYRAMGITTALGPQIDLSTEPRWMRLEDTLGSDPEKVIPLVKAYCDGMQTTENTPDGWGRDSVLTMVKHWPGGGTCEGGRDAHYPYGCFAVYPAGQFSQHMRPFTEGAFRLDGPTGKAGAVMPYYTVSWLEDNKKVGNSYSGYIIRQLLREKNAYDGIVCTDWGITGRPDEKIDSFGPRCYGMENLTVAQQHLRIILAGVDQFGGNNDIQPILEAWELGDKQIGPQLMDQRMRLSAERLLTAVFRLGLFEDPYLDPDRSETIVGCREYVRAGLAAQARSVVRLKNAGILPLKQGMKIYVPQRYLRPTKSFMRTPVPERRVDPLSRLDVSPWFERVSAPEEADAALVFMESPLSDPYDPQDAQAGGNGYRPLTLQYRPYTAENARAHSIAGGDFREKSADRGYRGKQNTAINEADLDNLVQAKKAGIPVIACLHMHNPTVPGEFEPLCDAVLVHFGVSLEVLLDILFGRQQAGGKLPYNLPRDMDAVESHGEDDLQGCEPYRAADGTLYEAGFSASDD